MIYWHFGRDKASHRTLFIFLSLQSSLFLKRDAPVLLLSIFSVFLDLRKVMHCSCVIWATACIVSFLSVTCCVTRELEELLPSFKKKKKNCGAQNIWPDTERTPCSDSYRTLTLEWLRLYRLQTPRGTGIECPADQHWCLIRQYHRSQWIQYWCLIKQYHRLHWIQHLWLIQQYHRSTEVITGDLSSNTTLALKSTLVTYQAIPQGHWSQHWWLIQQYHRGTEVNTGDLSSNTTLALKSTLVTYPAIPQGHWSQHSNTTGALKSTLVTYPAITQGHWSQHSNTTGALKSTLVTYQATPQEHWSKDQWGVWQYILIYSLQRAYKQWWMLMLG